MPVRNKKACNKQGCPELVEYGNAYCDKHLKEHKVYKRTNRKKQTMYNRRWQIYRKTFLSDNPFCVVCIAENRLTPATVVDHIVPHKDDYDLFWDVNNHQPMCKRCHDRKTATHDGGFGNR